MEQITNSLKESASQSVTQVNSQVADVRKDLGQLTTDIVEQKSSVYQNFQNLATNNINNLQKNFVKKGEQIKNNLLEKHEDENPGNDVLSEYEGILRDAMEKLKNIAQEDFKKSNEDTKKLIEDAKNNISSIVSHGLKDQNSRKEFSKTAESMLVGVHQKVMDDFYKKSRKFDNTTESLVSSHSNIFVLPTTKPPEEVEAEKLLQQYFESQLLDYKSQFQNDFNKQNKNLTTQVDEARNRITKAVNENIPDIKIDIDKTSGSPENLTSLPSKGALERNLNNLLSKAKDDFDKINESITKDVNSRKEQINTKTQLVAEKIFGKDCLGIEDDEDES